MSSLGFLTRDGEARVSGREHAKFSGLIDDLGWRAIERDCDPREEAGPSLMRQALTLPHWVTRTRGSDMRGLREETATNSPALRIGPDTLHDPAGFGTGATWADIAVAWRAPATNELPDTPRED